MMTQPGEAPAPKPENISGYRPYRIVQAGDWKAY
jgi:hypothetical protein